MKAAIEVAKNGSAGKHEDLIIKKHVRTTKIM